MSQQSNFHIISVDSNTGKEKITKRFAYNTKNAVYRAKANAVFNPSEMNFRHFQAKFQKALENGIGYGVLLSNGDVYLTGYYDEAQVAALNVADGVW